MAAQPTQKPTAKVISRDAEESVKRTVLPEVPRPQKPKAASRPKALMSRLQTIVPALLLWRIKIAAAHDLMTVHQWLLKTLKAALKGYDYPTIPDSLKSQADSEDQLRTAA
jgi:hypothetical protein